MNIPILTSTFFLTLLLMVGLFFFIRASAKDRTKQIKLVAQSPEAPLIDQLREYFKERAYQEIADDDAPPNQIILGGFVRPSWFLAFFLTALAGVGLLCWALILTFLYPSYSNFFLALILLAPGAGIYYWQKAGRWEQIKLQGETLSSPQPDQQVVTVTAHRDELIQLQQTLPYRSVEE